MPITTFNDDSKSKRKDDMKMNWNITKNEVIVNVNNVKFALFESVFKDLYIAFRLKSKGDAVLITNDGRKMRSRAKK